MKKKLFICSCGLKTEHLTLETIKALKSSEVVFSHSIAGGPAEAFIRGLCGDFRALVGRSPGEIAAAVAEAFRTKETIAFLTYGNPFFLNTAAGLLKSRLKSKGVQVEVLSAVSSFDSMVNLLDLNEFAAAGVRLVHAGLSGGNIKFSPETDTLVFMMDNLSRVERPEHAGALKKFIKGLSAAYPPGHEVLIVNAPFMEDIKGRILRTSVKNLERDFPKADKNSTLFIPELKK
ncbi:MAG TPA: hypothetical protein DCS63_09935 [Elusimicrobia bacterium]|nr:hypothetical protein [Elusimicrobiota bacterium]